MSDYQICVLSLMAFYTWLSCVSLYFQFKSTNNKHLTQHLANQIKALTNQNDRLSQLLHDRNLGRTPLPERKNRT